MRAQLRHSGGWKTGSPEYERCKRVQQSAAAAMATYSIDSMMCEAAAVALGFA
jgi:hypothetical protein